MLGLAHGNGTFVAVGGDAEVEEDRRYGVIYSSSDGLDWTLVASDLPVELSSVAYGNGRFIATGYSYGPDLDVVSRAYSSVDAQQWEEIELPPLAVSGMAFGNGAFVLGTLEGHLRSNDGLTWQSFGPAVESSGVEFAGGRS